MTQRNRISTLFEDERPYKLSSLRKISCCIGIARYDVLIRCKYAYMCQDVPVASKVSKKYMVCLAWNFFKSSAVVPLPPSSRHFLARERQFSARDLSKESRGLYKSA